MRAEDLIGLNVRTEDLIGLYASAIAAFDGVSLFESTVLPKIHQ